METVLRDLRFALRQLRRSPGFTLVAVLTLALGIGANTAMFSVVNAVLLRSLQFSSPDRLVRLFPVNTTSGARSQNMPYPALADIRDQSRSFAGIGAFRYWVATISGRELPASFLSVFVTEQFPRGLGVTPARGRWFQEGSDTPHKVSEVVLSDAVWRSQFGADPGVVGRTVLVEGLPLTVVGILPADFHFPDMVGDNVSVPSREPGMYLPTGLDPEGLEQRGNSSYWVIARLGPGVTTAAARSELQAIARQMAARYPDYYKDQTLELAPLKTEIVGGATRPLLILLGAVGVVLLIACANVAGLLLARASMREQEFALRTALGASRAGLIRQTLTESVLLGVIAGALGAFLGSWGVDLIRAGAPNTVPRIGEVTVDGRILGFTLIISLVCSVLFGLSPALVGSRRAAAAVRAPGQRGTAARGSLRSVLVVGEVALSVILLSGAGLLLRSFARVLEADAGFDGRNVISLVTVLPGARYPDDASRARFVADALERIRLLPGVESAAEVNTVPLSNLGGNTEVRVDGAPADEPALPVPYRPVAGSYFETMRIHVVAGRVLDQRDEVADAPPVAVLSQTAARRLFGSEDPVGRRVKLGNGEHPSTVVGVVRDVLDVALDQPAPPLVYYPFAQSPEPIFTLLARTRDDPYRTLPAIRKSIAAIDPALAPFLVRTMPELEAATLQLRQFHLVLLGGFALAALLLAAIGLYGLISYTVAQRTREIGIRVALGAGPGLVQQLLLYQGTRLVALGAGLGLLGALATSRLLRTQLVNIDPIDPIALGGTVLLLLLVTVIATLLPARRAMRVDPMVALRQG